MRMGKTLIKVYSKWVVVDNAVKDDKSISPVIIVVPKH